MIASISKAGLLSSRFHVWFVMAAVCGITIGHGGEVPGERKAPANPARPGAVEHIDADERRQAALLMPSLDAVEQSIRVFRADVRSRFEAGDFAWLEAKATELKRGEQFVHFRTWAKTGEW